MDVTHGLPAPPAYARKKKEKLQSSFENADMNVRKNCNNCQSVHRKKEISAVVLKHDLKY